MSQPTHERKSLPVLVRWAYQGLFALGGVVYLALRLARGRGLPGVRQRLAWYPRSLREKLAGLDRPIWIHAVSVGEVLAAEPFITALRARMPQQSWVITTVTPTGQSVAARLIRGPQDQLLYLPWDLGPLVSRAIRTIRPRLFISLETELWPALFDRLSRAQVPIFIINGRISPSAYRRYLWIRPFIAQVLECADGVLTQSVEDARRFAALGAAKDRIVVAGNMKWDSLAGEPVSSEALVLRKEMKLSAGEILWTAGSTHSGEEKIILEVYRELKTKYPQLRLLIAPRHPERTVEVENEVKRQEFSSQRRSVWKQALGTDGDGGSDQSVLLLDTLGELKAFYQISDIVFVGGSLIPKGGHNLVEPALFKRPILTGPHLFNFQAIAERLASAGAMAIVGTPQELGKRVEQLIQKPDLRREVGEKAYGTLLQHRGATTRTVNWILQHPKVHQERELVNA